MQPLVVKVAEVQVVSAKSTNAVVPLVVGSMLVSVFPPVVYPPVAGN